jgi:hypothetical protein
VGKVREMVVAKLVGNLLATATLWVRIQTSLKNTKRAPARQKKYRKKD